MRVIGRSRRSGFSAAAGDPRRGWLTAGGWTVPVALGRGGILANKREGDGGTPRGIFRPELWWRADRHPRPQTFLPVRRSGPKTPGAKTRRPPLQPADPADARAAGDRLTREDHLYDFIVEIDHNTRPVSPAAAARCSCIWRATNFSADRGLRGDDEIRDAAAVAADRAAKPKS